MNALGVVPQLLSMFEKQANKHNLAGYRITSVTSPPADLGWAGVLAVTLEHEAKPAALVIVKDFKIERVFRVKRMGTVQV